MNKYEIRFMRYNKLCTVIEADFDTKTLRIANATTFVLNRAFGLNDNPTWDDFIKFLESRCASKNCTNIEEYLKSLGLVEYNTLEILKKTKGLKDSDGFWIDILSIV